ncbi:hypothetical protein [Heyndrickxia oleronia]|uniref:hypothetical protein n=1 Tax=Heyndrickxia oleronia TaxID=38875 RepID=UPI001B0A64DD|nr:hypothetical protein J19TS1_50590 [Heyndrickxia oleronia]
MLKFEGIRGFHEELYNIGFLLVFNWKSWLNQNEIYRIEQTKYIYVDIQRRNNKRTCKKYNRLASDMVTNIRKANF